MNVFLKYHSVVTTATAQTLLGHIHVAV